ncbi:MAG TPA: methyltransferase [Opitutaceae bacterium]|nr:methyltransferase [Opitutaceae bacterium]
MNSSIELELPSVSFFGRSLAEYARFFDFDPADLRDRDVLDVAAGPSSFTAEANRFGIRAVAVDPMYGLQGQALAQIIELDYARMLAEMRRKFSLMRFRTFGSIDEAEADRRAAAARFLDDYAGGFAIGRYVGGALPLLPFADATFDLVLCAHLLFVYARRFHYDFHLAACLELCRVSRGEVRVHPIVELDGQPYRELDQLRRDLESRRVQSTIKEVSHEFFAGTNRTLILNVEAL